MTHMAYGLWLIYLGLGVGLGVRLGVGVGVGLDRGLPAYIFFALNRLA